MVATAAGLMRVDYLNCPICKAMAHAEVTRGRAAAAELGALAFATAATSGELARSICDDHRERMRSSVRSSSSSSDVPSLAYDIDQIVEAHRGRAERYAFQLLLPDGGWVRLQLVANVLRLQLSADGWRWNELRAELVPAADVPAVERALRSLSVPR